VRFVADESCDAAIVQTLREAGHDVVAVAERCPGAEDAQVISFASSETHVLVTEDKDFGQLVFACGQGHCGVVLLRYPFPLASRIADQLADLISRRGESLIGSFVVL